MKFLRFNSIILTLSLVLPCIGCGTSDKARLSESREAYLAGDISRSENALYTPEVLKNDQNRLLHYYFLGSLAMSEARYEKAIYFLNKARTLAISVRSDAGGFEWFSSNYRSNPIEFSYLHYLLVMANSMLAEEGRSPSWSTPEIKDGDGNVLIAAQTFPERVFSSKEIAEFQIRARAELKAWDTHLQDLKRTYPNENYYKEDLWAKILASFIHASSGQNNEKRTAELLMNDADEIFKREFSKFPSKSSNEKEIISLISKLKKRAQGKDDKSTLFVLEAGVLAQYKIKRFHLGLSTLMSQIKDPYLRSSLEQVGLQVLFSYAPEFGLIAFTGAIAGSVGANEDDEFDGPPRFFTDAVDRSFGFEIRFPSLQVPPSDTRVHLHLLSSLSGKEPSEMSIPVVSPLQEILAVELKERENKDMFARALRIAGQYLALLIPAVKSYQQADREGNGFKKLAILAGYYIGKKAIDHANNPDLRSWSYLPKLISADVLAEKPGEYDAKVTIDNSFGKYEQSLGKIRVGDPSMPLIYRRIGEVPILNRITPSDASLLR